MNSYQLGIVHKAYPNQMFDEALAAPANNQLSINSISLFNAQSAPNTLGIVHSVHSGHWKLWQLIALGTNTDVTAQIQAGTTTDLITDVDGDGFAVQSSDPFELLMFPVSQAEAGSPVYTYQYWNGTAFVDLVLLNTPHFDTASACQHIAFSAPLDWVAGNGGLAGLDDSLYTIQVVATTAPSQAVQIDALKLGKFILYRPGVAAYQQVQASFQERQLLLQQGEAILGYFGAANAGNTVEVSFQLSR